MTLAPTARLHRVEHKRPVDFYTIARAQNLMCCTKPTVHPDGGRFFPELRVVFKETTGLYGLHGRRAGRQRHLTPPDGLGLRIDDFHQH